jgi:hypothetical protein
MAIEKAIYTAEDKAMVRVSSDRVVNGGAMPHRRKMDERNAE